jgi:uncharacterized protein YnzC (UPF0291/DUF896 family)
MRNWIKKFNSTVRFIVSIIASREFALIYCLLGTFTQIAHTYFLAESISSFVGFFKVFQATLLSTFISSSLLYFVSIADNNETRESRNIRIAVNVFMYIEILINLYYYTRHLIIDAPEMRVFDFIFASVISTLIPVTIKLYASHIRAKEWFDDMMREENDAEVKQVENVTGNDATILVEQLNMLRESLLEEVRMEVKNEVVKMKSPDPSIEDINMKLGEFEKNIDKTVSDVFKEKEKLFLGQFENKLKLMMNTTQGRALNGMNQ